MSQISYGITILDKEDKVMVVIFPWGVGALIVNYYVSHKSFFKNKGLEYISQYKFRRKICLAYIAPQKIDKTGRELEMVMVDPEYL